jgi:hypothetical protein
MTHAYILQALMAERTRNILAEAEAERRARQAAGRPRRRRRRDERLAPGMPVYTDVGAEVITAGGPG